MVNAQKITAYAVCRFQRAEVFLVIFVEFAAQMQPNLVQHAGELHHAFSHFLRAFGVCYHAKSNRRCALSAQLDRLFLPVRLSLCRS